MKDIFFYINEALKIKAKSNNISNQKQIVSNRDEFNKLVKERFDNMKNGELDLSGIIFDNYGSGFNKYNVPSLVLINDDIDNIKHINVNNWDFSNAKSDIQLTQLFYKYKKVETIEGFDTWEGCEKIISLKGMFERCESLVDIDIFSEAQFPNVQDCSEMFYNCKNLKYIYCSGSFLNSVTNMSNMFYECESLINVDFGNNDVPNLTDCRNLFYECQSLKTIDLSNWTCGNINSTYKMFYNCKSLENIGDLSKWKTVPKDITQMFYNCGNLTLDISHWDYKKSKSQLFNQGVDTDKFKYNTNSAIDYNNLNNKVLDNTFESLDDLLKLFNEYFKSKFVKITRINKPTKFYKYNSGYGAEYEYNEIDDVIKIRCNSCGDVWELLTGKHVHLRGEVYYIMLRYQVEDNIQRRNKTREYMWRHTERISLNDKETLLNNITKIATDKYGGNTAQLFGTIFNIK
jgi:surface protein